MHLITCSHTANDWDVILKDEYEKRTKTWKDYTREEKANLIMTYVDEIKLWDVEYAMSGFLYTPVHKATWEACLSEDGTSTTYGTSMDTYMASGAYKLSYWEKGKEYRFTKNDNYFVWNENAENTS